MHAEERQHARGERLLQVGQKQAADQRDNTLTGRKNSGRQTIQLSPVGAIPPPGTRQCRCTSEVAYYFASPLISPNTLPFAILAHREQAALLPRPRDIKSQEDNSRIRTNLARRISKPVRKQMEILPSALEEYPVSAATGRHRAGPFTLA
jgi:hypothetical protein